MTETLQEKIDRLRELNKHRTQGDWKLCPHQHYGRPYTWAIAAPERDICGNNELYALLADGEFLSEAPTMIAVINELVKRLDVAREGVQSILLLKDNDGIKDARKALAATDLTKPLTD